MTVGTETRGGAGNTNTLLGRTGVKLGISFAGTTGGGFIEFKLAIETYTLVVFPTIIKQTKQEKISFLTGYIKELRSKIREKFHRKN